MGRIEKKLYHPPMQQQLYHQQLTHQVAYWNQGWQTWLDMQQEVLFWRG